MVRKRSSIADCRLLKLIDPDGLGEREAKVVIERTAYDVDQVKRSASRNCIHLDMHAQSFSCRGPIATRPSEMALTIGPVDQS